METWCILPWQKERQWEAIFTIKVFLVNSKSSLNNITRLSIWCGSQQKIKVKTFIDLENPWPANKILWVLCQVKQDTTLSASNEAIPKTATNVINIFVLASNFELDIEWFLTFLCCVITRIIKSKDYLNSKHPYNSLKYTCISNEYNEQRQEKCKNCPSYGQIAIH